MNKTTHHRLFDSVSRIKTAIVSASFFAAVAVWTNPSVAGEDRERPVEVSEEARSVHFSGMLFDGHNDLPWQIRDFANSSFDEMDIAVHQPNCTPIFLG